MPFRYTSKTSGALIGDIAKKLETPRLIELTGDVTGQAYFDGSRNIQIQTTVNAENSIGFGLTMVDHKTSVDLPALIGTEFGVNGEGKLALDAIDVNKLYVPEGTELIIGEMNNG